MTNQLVSKGLSYRGEPVFVSTPEEFDKVSTHHKVLYKCVNCGCETSVIKDGRFKERQRNLLCRQCNLSLSCSLKNGFDAISKPDVCVPIKAEADFDKIKNGRMIRYNCKKCGVVCETRVKSDRRDRLRRLLCQQCQCIDTNNCHWGVDYAMQNKDVLSKVHRKYNYNGLKFDSSWELAFWIYRVDNNISINREPRSFTYEFDGKTHKYFPDFEVNGQLYEIKGAQFFDENGKVIDPYKNRSKIFDVKFKCALENGVKFLLEEDIKKYIDYVNKKYGKGYLNSFKYR